jgi:hypothetical protein
MTTEADTERLIRQLAQSAGPVTRVAPLGVALSGALLAWLATALILVVGFGPWPSLFAVVQNYTVSAMIFVGLTCTGVGALLHALSSSVPGRDDAGRFGIGLMAVGAANIIGVTLHGGFPNANPGYAEATLQWDLVCIVYAFVLALPTAGAALWLCMAAAPFRTRATAAALAVGSSCLGAAMVQLVCGEASERHTVGSHMVALAVGVPLLAAILYAWLSHGQKANPVRRLARLS